MLPAQRESLRAGADDIAQKGRSFTDAVSSVFPANILPAIKAGEESGNLDKVFDQVWQAAKAQEEINAVIGKLKGPAIILCAGIIMSIVFLIALVPYVYESLGRNAPKNFDPGVMVRLSVAVRAWLDEWWMLAAAGVAMIAVGMTVFFSKYENRQAVSSLFVRGISKIHGVGTAYANLKFGLMARYLEIVSLAGLAMDRRISLVTEILPTALQPGMVVFGKEMLSKGIKDAAQPNVRNPDDPRGNPVFWPPYLRLAFVQAYETGMMEEPMREYGITMIEDGKERLQGYISLMNKMSIALAGLIVMIPMSSIYSVMGKIMQMQLSKM